MSACRTCTAPIAWAENVDTGKKMPLDVTPVPPFTKRSFALAAEKCVSEVRAVEYLADRAGLLPDRAAAQLADEDGPFTWHTSHFSSCPNADQHRRRR